MFANKIKMEQKNYKTAKKAPFSKIDGSLINHNGYFPNLNKEYKNYYLIKEEKDTENVEWREITKFHKQLQFIKIERNGEALPNVLYKEVETESYYAMHISDFETLMNENQIPIFPGKIWDCEWRVIKKYGKYWIAHIDPRKSSDEIK